MVLRSGRSGVSREAMAFVLDESWLKSPKNDRKSVRLVGVGNCVMESVMQWSTWYPSADKVNPAKVTLV